VPIVVSPTVVFAPDSGAFISSIGTPKLIALYSGCCSMCGSRLAAHDVHHETLAVPPSYKAFSVVCAGNTFCCVM
jgi:hypothetical protein